MVGGAVCLAFLWVPLAGCSRLTCLHSVTPAPCSVRPVAWPLHGPALPTNFGVNPKCAGSWPRLSLRGSCRVISSRARLHPWAGTFPWHLDSGLEAGLVKALAGTRTHGRGSSRPARAPPPTCCSSIPCPRRGRGGSSRPAPFLTPGTSPGHPPCHPRDSGLPTFHGSPLSLGHAHPRALWSGRGLRGPDCTLSHPTHRRLISITDAWDDRPVTQSIAIPDLGAPTPQATCKPHAVGPAGHSSYPEGELTV